MEVGPDSYCGFLEGTGDRRLSGPLGPGRAVRNRDLAVQFRHDSPTVQLVRQGGNTGDDSRLTMRLSSLCRMAVAVFAVCLTLYAAVVGAGSPHAVGPDRLLHPRRFR